MVEEASRCYVSVSWGLLEAVQIRAYRFIGLSLHQKQRRARPGSSPICSGEYPLPKFESLPSAHHGCLDSHGK